ncbi:cytochrome P450 [Mycena rosella]|uniref:Cytochrome P450 n=1 Tax=Mycena rosella TaxID=1033263 RepID=A0AAD7B5X2_MYCRO|nr:cytochrome P450 [Mycena rosella]
MIDLIGWDFNVGLMPYTDKWRKHRRLFQQCFRPDAARNYRPIQMTKIHDFLRGLLSRPEDFVALYKTVAAAVIMATMYGYQVEPIEDHFVTLSEEAVKMLSDAALPGAAAVNAFPFFVTFLAGCQVAECRKRTEEMQQVPFDFVKQNMVGKGTSAKSIVSMLLEANQAEGGSYQPEQVIRAVSATAYAAGSDTTVSSIGTFFYAMACIQKFSRRLVHWKAQSEIDNVIGTHRLPEFEDRPSLPYIEALYREVMRWKPVLPWGYFIPKAFKGYDTDESIYPEPGRFNPDRFFTADGSRHTADATVWATIVSVLSAFTIAKAKDEAGNEIDIDPVYSDGSLAIPQPFQFEATADL